MSPHKSARHMALCYVRQSQTFDENDMNSPDRQRANILAACQKYNWTPEWYEDVDGHKSGRDVKNRPGWLALSQRIGDSDVVAVVANDLARLHRKGWRVGDMIDHLEHYEIALVLAAPGREVDTTTPQGKMFAQFTAMMDEYYAEDISQRAKDSVQYRKSLGKPIGQPAFGTQRDAQGYLTPSTKGAWYNLRDGTFLAGTEANPPENIEALWRGYYQVAQRILELYAQGDMGHHRIAYRLNEEGYPFRDRKGRPRPVTGDDVRRVVGHWDTYGGIRTTQRSKERSAYDIGDVDEIVFNATRAVFPIDLLREVARTRQARTVKPQDHGRKRKNRFYPLSNLTYCAHCENLATQHDNPKLRSALNGSYIKGVMRYRHKPGVSCGTTNKSVPSEVYEADFKRLIDLLTIDPTMLATMTTLAQQAQFGFGEADQDFEQQKLEAIALAKRKINAAIVLYGDGHIDRVEYERRVEVNQRDMVHWEARTTETQQITLELVMCLEALDTMGQLWDISDNEDRQGMVRNLFSYLVYDLDTRRIVDFRLKPWADRFLVLRAALYEEGDPNKNASQEEKRGMPHTGFEPVF